jgi:hypothetical protein
VDCVEAEIKMKPIVCSIDQSWKSKPDDIIEGPNCPILKKFAEKIYALKNLSIGSSSLKREGKDNLESSSSPNEV